MPLSFHNAVSEIPSYLHRFVTAQGAETAFPTSIRLNRQGISGCGPRRKGDHTEPESFGVLSCKCTGDEAYRLSMAFLMGANNMPASLHVSDHDVATSTKGSLDAGYCGFGIRTQTLRECHLRSDWLQRRLR